MRKVFTLLLATVLLAGCEKNEGGKQDSALLPDLNISDVATKEVAASDIFTDFRVIPLETTDSSLIAPRFAKYVLKDSLIFVKSMNDVVIFDNNGKFLNRLSRVGHGPEEYDQILDIDIVSKYNEIWVSFSRGIVRYDISTLKFNGVINLPFFANAFKYLEDGTIIVDTPDDVRFKIVTMDGEVIKTFFENDRVNIGRSAVAFVNVDGRVVSQIDSTNDAVCYDVKKKEFSLEPILPQTAGLLTMADNVEYHKQYGELDFMEHIDESFTSIGAFRKVGDSALVTLLSPGREWKLGIIKAGESKVYPYFPQDKAMLVSNLAPTDSPMLFTTMICTDSSDSFVFVYNAPEDTEENPGLIVVKTVKLSEN